MTVLVIVAAVALIAGAVFLLTRGRGGGRGLRRRFGPEYERAVALHDGDARAAERDLGERVKRHGSLTPKPLSAEGRQRYEVHWAHAQERFVEAPRDAVAEVDMLLAELAAERGYPGRERYEDQLAALSVHHAYEVNGYRRVYAAAHDGGTAAGAGTEALREAMVDARALFRALLEARSGRRGEPGGTEERHRTGAKGRTGDKSPAHRRGRAGPVWSFNRHRAKES